MTIKELQEKIGRTTTDTAILDGAIEYVRLTADDLGSHGEKILEDMLWVLKSFSAKVTDDMLQISHHVTFDMEGLK